MAEKKSALGAGNVTVNIDGDDYTLKPTLHAIKALSAQYDGLSGCLDRLRRMDMNAFINVVNVGADIKGKEAKALEPAIFRTPMGELIGPLVEYVAVLMNGGRPLEDAEDIEDEADEGNV